MSTLDDEIAGYWDDNEDDWLDYDDWECAFPDNCCMPGDHLRSECYTPEMAEQYYLEMEREG